jgi:hypothetical protein
VPRQRHWMITGCYDPSGSRDFENRAASTALGVQTTTMCDFQCR